MEQSLRILSRRLVRPEPVSSRTPEPETLHLTPWDPRMTVVEYIQKGILLPKPPSTAGAVEHLMSSLGRALGRFYPLAGRLAVTAIHDGAPPPRSAMSLRCTDDGTEFVHAAAPGVTAADITSSGFYIPRLVWDLFPLNGLRGVDAIAASSPVLAVQATELADGIFVAVSLNHGVADGTTLWHFLNTWSEISRAGDDGREISSPSPVLERWFLDSCPVPIPLRLTKVEDIVPHPRTVRPPVQECFFHFSADAVKALKVKANAEMAIATISSLQALLAHLWRSACRARGLAPDQEVAYAILVGCRPRVKGIPQGYVGNAVVGAVAKSTTCEVLNRRLGWTAWLLNRAVASIDESTAMEQLESWSRNPSLAIPTASLGPAAVITGSSPRFDVYGNDFGWGRPVAVRSGAGNKNGDKVTVYEGRDGGGSMALEVCLPPDALAMLVADEELWVR